MATAAVAAPVVVMGSSGHAAEVCAYLTQIAAESPGMRLLGCIDDQTLAKAYQGRAPPIA